MCILLSHVPIIFYLLKPQAPFPLLKWYISMGVSLLESESHFFSVNSCAHKIWITFVFLSFCESGFCLLICKPPGHEPKRVEQKLFLPDTSKLSQSGHLLSLSNLIRIPQPLSKLLVHGHWEEILLLEMYWELWVLLPDPWTGFWVESSLLDPWLWEPSGGRMAWTLAWILAWTVMPWGSLYGNKILSSYWRRL